MREKIVLISTMLLFAGVSFHNPSQVVGQSYGGCVDSRGKPVASIPNYNINDIAIASVGPNGEPVIYYNPRVLASAQPATRTFFYMHECGHHVLGHSFGGGHPLSNEQAADCFAVVSLVRDGEFDKDDVRIVQEDLSRFGRADWTHLPGPQRAINLSRCLNSGGSRGSGEAVGNQRVASFYSLAGIKYGDTIENVRQKYGNAEKTNPGKSLSFDLYFDGGLEIGYKPGTHQVKTITVQASAVREINKRGIQDENLRFLGQHKERVVAAFGRSMSSDSDDYEYHFARADGQGVFVTFSCYDSNKCNEVDVHWR